MSFLIEKVFWSFDKTSQFLRTSPLLFALLIFSCLTFGNSVNLPPATDNSKYRLILLTCILFKILKPFLTLISWITWCLIFLLKKNFWSLRSTRDVHAYLMDFRSSSFRDYEELSLTAIWNTKVFDNAHSNSLSTALQTLFIFFLLPFL